MRFQKGYTPWNKGKKGLWKMSDETKQKISNSNKGKKPHLFTEESRQKMSKAKKGKIPWIAGKHHTEEARRKMSEAKKGKKPWNKGIPTPKETREKQSKAKFGKYRGQNSPSWKGGMKVSIARLHAKEDGRGFILLSYKNPYNEPIEYHHIHPDLPFVVPCPKRIHQAFGGGKSHFNNVNAMLGLKFDYTELKEIARSKEANHGIL